MGTLRAWAVVLVLALAGCTGSSADPSTGSAVPSSAPPSGTGTATSTACPTDKHAIEALLGESIAHVEGAAGGSTEQVCAFSTSATDVGALGVVYLRFPRPALGVTTLAAARRKYGSALAGHTVVSMPSWGTDAFLDESLLPQSNLVAEFAWVPGFEVILGMHSNDRHVEDRRQLIDKLVAFTR